MKNTATGLLLDQVLTPSSMSRPPTGASIVFHDYLNKVLAGNRAFSPSPLMGEGRGGGGKILMMTISFSPSPQPPPTRGGGEIGPEHFYKYFGNMILDRQKQRRVFSYLNRVVNCDSKLWHGLGHTDHGRGQDLLYARGPAGTPGPGKPPGGNGRKPPTEIVIKRIGRNGFNSVPRPNLFFLT